MQQALDYAEMLDVPVRLQLQRRRLSRARPHRYAAGTVEREIPLDEFPIARRALAALSQRQRATPPTQEAVATQDYYDDGSGKAPRYYQLVAINRTVEAIARGENRILLVMATGTGKTYTAFQIIWRLWKAGAKKRILFLADRNILVDQTQDQRLQAVRPGDDQDHQPTRSTRPTRSTSSLYQAVTGTEEEQNIYKQFSPDFFDLIVVDECHRGSAARTPRGGEILEYFSSATQIGMTATPKETKDVSNIDYFGEPIYTYSLKQGIEDGFLAPYKVVRIDLDKDLEGWRPEQGKIDEYGQVDRRPRVQRSWTSTGTWSSKSAPSSSPQRSPSSCKATDRFAKTIVFCENIDHAERMRQALVNANADLAAANSKYVMRITGDNDEGKAQLDNFIDPESTYPGDRHDVAADDHRRRRADLPADRARQRIKSMTEFKQIIGRGTRINEDYGKFFFTIMDFKQATELCSPTRTSTAIRSQIYEPGQDEPTVPPGRPDGDDGDARLRPRGLPVDRTATGPMRPRTGRQVLRRRRRGHASPPSACSTSTPTAS